MGSTRAVRTSQGSIQYSVNRVSTPATGSATPQNADPSLITVCVRSVTPRNTPIQGNFSGTWLATGSVVGVREWFTVDAS